MREKICEKQCIVRAVITVVARITSGVDPRSAPEGIYLQAAIVRDGPASEIQRSRHGFQRGIFFEGRTCFFDLCKVGNRLQIADTEIAPKDISNFCDLVSISG